MTEQEFGHIVQEHSGTLKALARRFGRATDMAIGEEDIVQEALLAFWQLCEKGYPVLNPKALLVKITKNICVSHYRRHHLETETITSDVFPGGTSASVEVEKQDAARLRKELYDTLTPSELQYTRLREETDWSLDQMAAKTGKDKSVIKSLLSKSKRKMKQILKNQ